MDATLNPYAPGAGTPPPTLAGRDKLLESARIALARIRIGRPAKSFIAVGLRGVGKTVIMNEVQKIAEAEQFHSIYIEAYDEIRFPEVLAKALRPILLKLSRKEAAHHLAVRAWAGLRNFASAFDISFQGIDVSVKTEEGLADTGDITADLPDLLVSIGEAAKATATALTIIIDEVQYLSELDMSALIMALHRCNQKSLPVVLFGAGLPQLRGRMGDAKSYVERLFDFPEIDALPDDDARMAIEKPANDEGVRYSADALAEILRVTACYPYFIQEWGHFAWATAKSSPITLQDVTRSHDAAIAKLDESFFRVRLDRMTPTERRYMRALADLGPGPHRSGDVAKVYGAPVTSAAPIRSGLIAKGMIYSPAHGDTAFTVPLFDEFMRREMPDRK
ncbi:ATP-binding protein [Lichenicola cladoniae]|uniref:ATP-binding protein n=1 Tax=Lichenicola cladoniae TaxID=1484109 RepID=A0A6M8HN98_9PROT|nr:ATP-binding protein [Lichenicola cladoniae]NPD67337.1 ATP-binding protein [Acetobacteraceae bacterium]QKE89838.1 ATP-binding protein [Lichenicola cladoniae]